MHKKYVNFYSYVTQLNICCELPFHQDGRNLISANLDSCLVPSMGLYLSSDLIRFIKVYIVLWITQFQSIGGGSTV